MTKQLAIGCTGGLLLLSYVAQLLGPKVNAFTGHNDYLAFAVGANLVGSGQLYDTDANYAMQRQLAGGTLDNLLYIRLPHYAVALKPLTALPYQAGYVIFQFASITAFVAFLWLFAREWPILWFAGSISFSLLATILFGQDTTFVTLALGLFYVLSERNHPVAGGLALAVCIIKPHLFLPLALVLLVRREWRLILTTASAGVAFALVGVAAEGWLWPVAWLARLRDGRIHPTPSSMPNIHGLAAGIGTTGIEITLSIAVIAAIVWIGLRTDRSTALAAALIAGVLLSWHSYVADTLILFAALVMLHRAGRTHLAAILLLALSPALIFLQWISVPLLPAMLLVILSTIVCTVPGVIRWALPKKAVVSR